MILRNLRYQHLIDETFVIKFSRRERAFIETSPKYDYGIRVRHRIGDNPKIGRTAKQSLTLKPRQHS